MFNTILAGLMLLAPGTPAAHARPGAVTHRVAAPTNRICPVLGNPVTPGKSPVVHVWGHAYYVCCSSCKAKLTADPGKYLLKDGTPRNAAQARKASTMKGMKGM